MEVTKLIISGEADYDTCFEKWEGIVRQNSKATGNFDYLNYFETMRQYGRLLAQYNIAKACLLKLSYIPNDQLAIRAMSKLGITINTTDDKAWTASMKIAKAKSNNILTKLLSKKAILDQTKSDKSESVSVEDILASLSMAVGYEIKEDVTLARYNAYRKQVKKNGRIRR